MLHGEVQEQREVGNLLPESDSLWLVDLDKLTKQNKIEEHPGCLRFRFSTMNAYEVIKRSNIICVCVG